MPPITITPPSTTASTAQHLLHAHHDTPVLAALFDGDDMLLWANPAFRQAYGLAPDQLLTWSDLMQHNYALGIGALIRTDDIEVWLASARSRRGKVPFRAFECDLRDGRWIWMTESVQDDGSMLCLGSDITSLRRDGRDLRQERDMAQRAAMTDTLTGISNRAHIMEQLRQQVQRTRTQRSSCGIAVIDLDFFKKINDRFGHPGGDLVLQHFAQLLRQTLRREDGFGRIGGEEFLLVLPGAQHQSLHASMQRLLDMLPLQRPLVNHPDFFYTCSIGGSLLYPNDTVDSALQRVDEALYVAKAQGRHRFEWAAPPAH